MAESKQRESGAYTKSEMTRVVVDEQVLPDPVPSAWVGTSLLPDGAKKATKAQVSKADGNDDDSSGSSSSSTPADTGSDTGASSNTGGSNS